MNRNSGIESGMLERQLEHDREMRNNERLHSLIIQGAKGLSVLNGGAAVAVLAFIQALIDKPAYLCFKPYAVSAISGFLLGAFLPAIVFFFHFAFLNRPYQDSVVRKKKWRAVWGLLATSAILALVGGTAIAVGVWSAL